MVLPFLIGAALAGAGILGGTFGFMSFNKTQQDKEATKQKQAEIQLAQIEVERQKNASSVSEDRAVVATSSPWDDLILFLKQNILLIFAGVALIAVVYAGSRK